MTTLNQVAGGNIGTSLFVKKSTAADFRVLQAGANDAVFGISQVGQKYAPLPSNTNVYAAEAGDNVAIYGPGEYCMLLAGSGGWTRGDFLKSDASGAGVTIASTGATAQNVGAIADETVAAGVLGRVRVYLETKVYPALS